MTTRVASIGHETWRQKGGKFPVELELAGEICRLPKSKTGSCPWRKPPSTAKNGTTPVSRGEMVGQTDFYRKRGGIPGRERGEKLDALRTTELPVILTRSRASRNGLDLEWVLDRSIILFQRIEFVS